MIMLRYPLIVAVCILCALLCGIGAWRPTLRRTVTAVLAEAGLIVGGLACMLPYTELVLLLLPSLIAAMLFAGKGAER